MSLLSLNRPAYAETHFKFKLPWSLLYRKRPEIIVDVPSQINANKSPEFWIVVRDADRFPLKIKSIELKIKNEKQKIISIKKDLNIFANEPFSFYSIVLDPLPAGTYEITPSVETIQKNHSKKWIRWNYPFLKPLPLKIQVLKEPYFIPSGFVAGEMHCHTHYSSDHVEFGAAPHVLQSAARLIGLDFVLCTDHAYDFAFSKEDYTLPDQADVRFEALRQEIQELPSSPLMIAGEEVSVGNSHNENVHMLCLSPREYLEGKGDCGRYGLNNKPTWGISKTISIANAPCFAAHPKVPMSKLERFVFRRGDWHDEDLQLESETPIRGIQFWNGSRDRGFELGRLWWISLLEKGHEILPIGGNDAHGDLNDSVSITMPLISLRHNRNHVFGKVKTVVKVNDSNALTIDSLKEGFQGDSLYLTDGPALWWSRENDFIHFQMNCSADFGTIQYLHFYTAEKGDHSPEKLHPTYSVFQTSSQTLSVKIPLKDFRYVRAESETSKGHFALTSAAFAKEI
jgi:hypothetical protein